MRRRAVALVMVAALGGCMQFQTGPETGGGASVAHWGKSYGPPTVPGVKGPYGERMPMAAPYNTAPPPNAYMAQQMMGRSIPLSAVQMHNPAAGMGGMMPPGAGMPPTAFPRGPMLSPPGVPFAPGAPGGAPMGAPPMGAAPTMLPTAGMHPANMPARGGVINANVPPGMMPGGGIMQAQMVQANPAAGVRFQGQRTQIRFVRPSGMKVSWFTQGPDGKPMFSTTPVETPGRYNFPQAAIYRLKLSNIEGRPGLEVYPTMEVVPSNPKTEAFLAHSAVPIDFTSEDFKQISDGNYVVKVIYLPDPQFQDVAGTGTDEILSTRLEPGADPIQEALRRGSILVVLRMGNVDQEAPNTPSLNAPGPQAPMMGHPGMGHPGMMPPAGVQLPFWGMKPGMPPFGPMVAPEPPPPPVMPPATMNGNGSGPGDALAPSAPPGTLSIPSVPLPANTGAPVAPPSMPVSTPKEPVSAEPGVSSTSKFQKTSATPETPPSTPATNTPADLPRDNGPAFPPPVAPAPGLGAAPSTAPDVPALPVLPSEPASDAPPPLPPASE